MSKKAIKKTVKKKKYKIKYQNIIICFFVVFLMYSLLSNFLKKNITNIYIINNSFFSDQEIIEMADLQDYPNNLKNSTKKIKNKLENNIYIKSANVYKKNIAEVYIEIEENRPLFYRSSVNTTVLLDGRKVEEKINAPTLINYVPDTIYDKFVEYMANVNVDILKRISEIEYNPNSVDDERFLLTMTDDNYVYLTLRKFDNINDYVYIIKNFDEKGILYLDSGEYFKIMN